MRTTDEILKEANDQILKKLTLEEKPVDNTEKISLLESELAETKDKMKEEISFIEKQYRDNRNSAIKFFEKMGFTDISSFHGSPNDFSEKYCYLKNSLKQQYYNLTQAGKGNLIRHIKETFGEKISKIEAEIKYFREEKPADIFTKYKYYEVKTLCALYYSSKVSDELKEEVKRDHILSHEIGEKTERFGHELTPHKITFSDGSVSEWDE